MEIALAGLGISIIGLLGAILWKMFRSQENLLHTLLIQSMQQQALIFQRLDEAIRLIESEFLQRRENPLFACGIRTDEENYARHYS